MARIKKMQSGGKSSLGMKSVKAGYDKNPGVTRADIIVAAKKEAKYGKKIKKAEDGEKLKVSLRSGQLKRLGKLSAKNPEKAQKVGKRFVEKATRTQRGVEYLKKNAPSLKPSSSSSSVEMKKGGKMKKCRGGCY
jgi:outer membrane usher protein FimD/PapC